jgi:hypothetical protein
MNDYKGFFKGTSIPPIKCDRPLPKSNDDTIRLHNGLKLIAPKPYKLKTKSPPILTIPKDKKGFTANYKFIGSTDYITSSFESLTIYFTHSYDISIFRDGEFISLSDYLTSRTVIDLDADLPDLAFKPPHTLVKRRLFKHSFGSGVHLVIKTDGFVDLYVTDLTQQKGK